MYQGTTRAPYLGSYKEEEDEEDDRGRLRWEYHTSLITPIFRIKSPHLTWTRPDGFGTYTKHIDCELHSDFAAHEQLAREQDLGCPCAFGNIDMAFLLDSFGRQHGVGGTRLHWSHIRYRFRYSDLLETVLGQDRPYPLLNYMKSMGGMAFDYQELGKPGMETNNEAMAYNIGDVAGLNLIFEQFLACRDKRYLGAALLAYTTGGESSRDHGKYVEPPAPVAHRLVVQQKVGECQCIPLVLENPEDFNSRTFSRKAYNISPFDGKGKGRDRLAEGFYKTHYGPQAEQTTSNLTLWEHNHRVAMMRSRFSGPKPLPTNKTFYESPIWVTYDAWRGPGELWQQQHKVLHYARNPTMLRYPETMIPTVTQEYEEPVVRAGATHAEALIEFLYSPQAAGAAAPPGFAAPPASRYGLPKNLKRVPGASLDCSQAILDAFSTASTYAHRNLLPPSSLRAGLGQAPAAATPLDEEEIINGICGEANDVWAAARQAKQTALTVVQTETASNTNIARPYLLDETDVFDPEGRDYRKRALAAAPWNRPLLHEYYETGVNGEWRSMATVKLELLDRKVPELDKEAERRHWAPGRVVGGRVSGPGGKANGKEDDAEWKLVEKRIGRGGG
jgi:hypothetical protein